MERLLFLGFFMIFFFHITACLFVLLADLAVYIDDDETLKHSWIYDNDYQNLEPIDKYIVSTYFVITTVSTVGYGDISATTTFERVYCACLMLFGVTIFTFISGALSSILSNYDHQQA